MEEKEAIETVENYLDSLKEKEERNSDLNGFFRGDRKVRDPGKLQDASLLRMSGGLGWCRIAVEALAERISIFSIGAKGDEGMNEYIQNVIEENDFIGAFNDKGVEDMLLYGVSFILVAKGDTSLGYPKTVISIENPNSIYGKINNELGIMDEAIRVVNSNQIEYWTKNYVHNFSTTDKGDVVYVNSYDNDYGVVPIIPIINKPNSMGWGKSEISPDLQRIYERAQRHLYRMEITAQRYSIPQRYFLGLSRSELIGNGGYSGGILQDPVITIEDKEPEGSYDNENTSNQRAEIGTLESSNPENHIKPFDKDREEFANVAALPPTYMGITTANPSSADAIRMNESRIVKRAENRINTSVSYLKKLVRLIGKTYEGEAESWVPSVIHNKPHTNTEASTTDAVIKQIQAGIIPADSPITLQKLGYSDDEIQSLMAHTAKKEGSAITEFAKNIGLAKSSNSEEITREEVLGVSDGENTE